ncbi:hypothetical protein [Bradyrhizobium sp. NAS80.1]|uniref:hypothetical protein n=1 Tax=Bradyrhizobium sp. NAS80.1 TaxID=1680159 RepID=UPI00116151FB|nr:hypothetical protein [Bradyrhizobium sp. NAS80.1]
MRLLSTAAILLALAAPAHTGKLDIAGFSPGMPDPEFRQKLTVLNCQTDTCQFDGKVIQFRRAGDRSIQQVAYRFSSDLKPREQIDAIAREYGVATRKQDIGDIGHAMGRYDDYMFVGKLLHVGGPLCRWRLGNRTTLQLALWQPPGKPGQPFVYVLYLADERKA